MLLYYSSSFFFNDPAPTEIYTLSLHDALPILLRKYPRPSEHPSPASLQRSDRDSNPVFRATQGGVLPENFRTAPVNRSEEHTSELQSQSNLVCRLLLEKKKKKN